MGVQASAEDGATDSANFPPPTTAEAAECVGASGSTGSDADASAAEAKALFAERFPCILESLEGDPPQADPDANGGGEGEPEPSTESLASMPPLRAPDASGNSTPIDLSLETEGTGVVPANPLVDVALPAQLGERIPIGDRGVAIDPAATDPTAAETASAAPLAGEGLFYANAAPATDIVLAPISVGLETVYQLRGPQSPERLEIGLTLPEDAWLEPAVGGGAQIVQDGQAVASIYRPLAVDPEGNSIESTMTVTGNSLEVSVPHIDPDIAYPIAVTVTAGSFVPEAPAQASSLAPTVTPGMNGVNLLGGTGPDERAHAADMGAKVIRYWVAWCQLEHTPGTYTRNQLQGAVNAVANAHAEGMEVLIVLKTSAPPFARTAAMQDENAPCNGENPGAASIAGGAANAVAYGTAIKKIAWCLNADPRCNDNLDGGTVSMADGQMLKNGWVYGFEAGNEPNTRSFWNNGMNTDGSENPEGEGTITRGQANIYHGVLDRAAAELHGYAANAGITIKVSGAGLSYGDPNGHSWGEHRVDATAYLDQVLSNGNPRADAYAIHPYGAGLHPNMENINGVPVNTDATIDTGATRQILINRGYGYTKPIWITEMGSDADGAQGAVYGASNWPDNDVVGSEEELIQLYDLYFTWWNSIRAVCDSWNVPLAVYWNFRDLGRYESGQQFYAGFAKMVQNPDPPPPEIINYSKQAYAQFESGNYLAANTCTG
jgi:hypothetical protein